MNRWNPTVEEPSWLEEYRRALDEKFPDLGEEMVIFGSKARGGEEPDSDLDILVILREGDSATKREVRHVGHRLAVMADAVPSTVVYTRNEWLAREQNGSPFYRAVLRDGVPVQ